PPSATVCSPSSADRTRNPSVCGRSFWLGELQPGRRGRPPGRPPSLSFVLWRLLGLRADLLEESHRVEVVAALLDLVALEGEEEGSGRLVMLARGRDRSFCGSKWARVRALPGHFQGRRVARCGGACGRPAGIRDR